MNDLPDVIRKAIAYRFTLSSVLGFDLDRQTFMLFTPNVARAPVPLQPGEIYVASILSVGGDPERSIEFAAVTGAIRRDDTDDIENRMIAAWNPLSQTERSEERRRWVTWLDVQRMALHMLERGIEIPSITSLEKTTTEPIGLRDLHLLYVN
jgi:hypothetical protein